MTKTIGFKKATAIIMAVFMMFAALSVTAFANGNVDDIYNYGSPGSYTVKITYKDCDHDGATTNRTCFKLESAKSVNIKFYTTTPSTVIKFYRNGSDAACATFTTPKYVSGMPGTLTTAINLQAGSYRVGICSAEYTMVDGVIELYHVDKLDQ